MLQVCNTQNFEKTLQNKKEKKSLKYFIHLYAKLQFKNVVFNQ